MGKAAILFSGQGSQYSEMGLDLYEKDPLFKETLDRINSEIGSFDLLEVLADKNQQLEQTMYQQPAIVALGLGLNAMVKRDLPELPLGGIVGLSLGEYAALITADALSEKDGIKALEARARFMQEDAENSQSKMAALLKPDIAAVEQICRKLAESGQIIAVSNYNSPKQVVIGGQADAVSQAIAQITDAKAAKRAIELAVSGAFHTKLFANASDKMSPILNEITFSEPSVPVISNTTGQPFAKESIPLTLVKQIVSPTHFADCISYLFDNEDVDTTIELGPGGTLTQFVKQVDRKVKRYQVEDHDTYQAFLEEIRGN